MPGTIRLKQLQFAAGPSQGRPSLDVEIGTALLLVGPNNSGKSATLKEIADWCWGYERQTKLLRGVEVDFPNDPIQGRELIRPYEQSGRPGLTSRFWPGHVPLAAGSGGKDISNIREGEIESAIESGNLAFLRDVFSAFFTIRLDARTRFTITEPRQVPGSPSQGSNHFEAMLGDSVAQEMLSKLTGEAFGLHAVIDPTEVQRRIRMSTKPIGAIEDQPLKIAHQLFSKARPLQEFSDGVQAFVGILVGLLCRPSRVILIDDPEAFLHPPHARRLGRTLTAIAGQRTASLVASTHSPEFLAGCIETDASSGIVRLTYEDGLATARCLSSDEVALLMDDPLLRSTGVLGALFHRAAIVTEADADRAFYEEVNRRLESEGRGIGDALFLNAQGKGTVHRLIKPLRSMGIPAAAVVDLDLINQRGAGWCPLLEACQIPKVKYEKMEEDRKLLWGKFRQVEKSTGRNPVKKMGVAVLDQQGRELAESLLCQLATYGLFLVPSGELESWLPELGVGGKSRDWLKSIFNKMGRSGSNAGYLKPEVGGVWKFIDDIAAWVGNPARLGTE